MAEADQQAQQLELDDEGTNPDYRPPAQKSLDDILKTDQEDESLRKYKETLLGEVSKDGDNIFWPDEKDKKVIIKKMCLVFKDQERKELEIDLTKPVDPKTTFVIKEGTQYRIKIVFCVQREIVAGLRYFHTVKRKGLKVDSESCMVGSYGPKSVEQSYSSPWDDAPSGMLARGTYNVKSCFTDDDKNKYCDWEWRLEVKKDW